MTSEDLAQWRKKMNWTKTESAAQLGIDRTTFGYYETGSPKAGPIPRYIALACEALLMRARKPKGRSAAPLGRAG